MFRRVRTYRMTFRRNGGTNRNPRCWYVCTQQKSVKRSLSKQHIPSCLGCFNVHGLLKKRLWTQEAEGSWRRTASRRRADHGKRRRHFRLGQQRSPQQPHFRLGQQRSPQQPHSPSGEPSENPRHFAASMDESIIVGYYTLKKCRSPALPLSVNLKERKRQWQETME